MSTELSKPTTTEFDNLNPKNARGEFTENVDLHIIRRRRAKHHVTTIEVYAIIDHPTEGAPYEETGRELLHVYTRELEGEWEGEHWQSWRDITSNGWNDSSDYLHHQSLIFHQLAKAAAEAGLMMVRGVVA